MDFTKKNRLGTNIVKTVAGESYKVYIPPLLPLDPPIKLDMLSGLLEKAAAAASQLNNVTKFIPNKSLFIYMYVRKEALLSSQIEGTQSSFSDLILFEHQQQPHVAIEDVEEVSNYVAAINYGLKRLNQDDFPLSLRLIKETHAVLLSGGRGAKQLPGEFRTSQNWIGGTRPGNALFVPPPPEHLPDCLANFEQFLHEENLPILIKAAIAHVQFETIHPFLDGNGRLGRLLITLLLANNGLIDQPILYLSLYLKQNRELYYNLLQEVRYQGAWETWVEFFLTGVLNSSNQVIKTTEELNKLFTNDLKKLQTLGRSKFSCEQILSYLKQLPQVSVPLVAKDLDISQPTARSSLNALVKLDILTEITGKQRDKVYVYKQYLDILEYGAEPI
jgi:Fic family protein